MSDIVITHVHTTPIQNRSTDCPVPCLESHFTRSPLSATHRFRRRWNPEKSLRTYSLSLVTMLQASDTDFSNCCWDVQSPPGSFSFILQSSSPICAHTFSIRERSGLHAGHPSPIQAPSEYLPMSFLVFLPASDVSQTVWGLAPSC